MRLKLKWVLLSSALIVGLWLLVIIVLPAPLNTDSSQKEARNGKQNFASNQDDTAPFEENRGIKSLGIVAHEQRPYVFEEREVDIVGIDVRDEETDRELDEENEVPHGVEIANDQVEIADDDDFEEVQGGPHKGEKLLNKTLPLEQDLVPVRFPKTRRELFDIWKMAGSWVNSDQITSASATGLGDVMYAMANAPITKADVGFKGTQLKARLLLEGGQVVVFKPKRYSRDYVVYGTPYAGYDRHNGEIAAFHLDRVLDFRRAPIVVGRKINLETEIIPVASQTLNETFLEQDGNICFYGKCYYCKPDDAACADGDIMEGSLTLWLPQDLKLKKWRHLWSRTYKEGKKAKWETDDDYCTNLMTRVPPDRHPLILHKTDAAVFDYLIGNADRHMYETFEKDGDRAMLLHMDNAKSFGNPYVDEPTILAPIYQCCRLRRSTWNTLQQYKNGRLSHVMTRVLSHDPIAPILTNWHLEALDRRLNDIIDTMHNCFTKHGENVVLVS